MIWKEDTGSSNIWGTKYDLGIITRIKRDKNRNEMPFFFTLINENIFVCTQRRELPTVER